MLTVNEFERVKQRRLKPASIQRSSEIVVSNKTADSAASFRSLSTFFQSRWRRCNQLHVRVCRQFSNRRQFFFRVGHSDEKTYHDFPSNEPDSSDQFSILIRNGRSQVRI